MVRLGASTQELAYEVLESLLGHPNSFSKAKIYQQEHGLDIPDEGHKPARADIQKLKDLHDEWKLTSPPQPGSGMHPSPDAAQKWEEWSEKTGLDDKERELVAQYQHLIHKGFDPNTAFEQLAYGISVPNGEPETQGKQQLGQAIKKYEMQHAPSLFPLIDNSLTRLFKESPESYKMWPWAVKQIKAAYDDWLWNTNNSMNSTARGVRGPLNQISHIIDITKEGGELLSRLKAENKTPQNFDFNQIDFQEFEDWLMQWKRDNREAEAQGETVYAFHDGWTIQRLTTPEQLQFEGDEMGHCVGGYASQVESGESVIYSLRDDKGMPHTTFEVEGLWDTGPAGEDGEYIAPHDYPGTETPKEAFQVTQVQGKSDNTPKPEYQRKIKEFLDTLRAKGIKFERSEDWYGNNDDRGDEDYEIGADGARGLHEWYEQYQSNPKAWQSGGEDAYGMNAAKKIVDLRDIEEIMDDQVRALIDHSERGEYKTSDWQTAAQATYHLYYQNSTTTSSSPEYLQKIAEVFEKAREQVEQRLHDIVQEQIDAEWDYNPAGISQVAAEIYETLGGTYEEDVPDNEEAQGYIDAIPGHQKTPTNEDLWQEAQIEAGWKIEQSYAGNAYKYLQYLYSLNEGLSPMRSHELPDPNQGHGGLPSFDEAQAQMQAKWSQPQASEIPGSFS